MKNRKFIYNTFLFCMIASYACAQKLPNKQAVSVYAPAGIKIDGKATEWNDQYQAYNKATEIYYTLSNDGNNLYLTIKAKSSLIIDKIIRNGVCFIINHTINKKDISPVTITYPVLQRTDRNSVAGLFNSRLGKHNNITEVDNSIEVLNNLLAKKSKYINITGITDIPDENISVFNDLGIKAVSKFDTPLIYVYELAIPLKYLVLPNNGTDAFSYHIKLNAGADFPQTTSTVLSNLPPPPPPDVTYIADTDFWGEYTLAKKD